MPIMNADQWRSLSVPQGLELILEKIGARLFPPDRQVAEYIVWSIESGLIDALISRAPLSAQVASELSTLSVGGAKAMLGVLCASGLAKYVDGDYIPTQLTTDFLNKKNLHYVGNEFYLEHTYIPPLFLKDPSDGAPYTPKMAVHMETMKFGGIERLLNQQTRNLASSIAAVHSGEFDDTRRLLDVAGGSGVFSIPLALRLPELRVTLTELPIAVPNAQVFIDAAGLTDRIDVIAQDVFETPWNAGTFDTVFIGNLLHGFSDEKCISICRECFNHLPPGGKIWLHEILWNDDKDGPMIAALINTSMALIDGGQRTRKELFDILAAAGFEPLKHVPTASAMGLIGGVRP